MIMLGILGLAVMGVLLVLSKDFGASLRTGRPWKRRLVAAAMTLLASGGVYSGYELYRIASGPEDDLRTLDHYGRPGPAESPQWRRLAETWRQAEEIVSRRKGGYPFTGSEKAELLRELRARGGDVGELAVAGILSAAEAGLLENGLKELAEGIANFRVVEDMGATCYDVTPDFQGAERSLTHLANQMTLLNMLVESGRISPDVVAKVVPQIEADLNEIDHRGGYLQYLAEHRKRLASGKLDAGMAKWTADLLVREPVHSADQIVDRTKRLLARIKGQPMSPASQPGPDEEE
jgi:hypothetical protein